MEKILADISEVKKINFAGMMKKKGLILCNLSHKAGIALMRHKASRINIALDMIYKEYSDYFTYFSFNEKQIAQEKPDYIYIINDENFYLDNYQICKPIDSVEKNIHKIINEITSVISLIEKSPIKKTELFISSIYLNREHIKQYISLDDQEKLQKLALDFSERMRQLKSAKINIQIIDMSGYSGESVEYIYSEYNTVANLKFLNYFCEKCIDYLRLKEGRSLKCIITDLDNTLWEGILAEENAVEAAETKYAGLFKRYQRWLKRMHQQGIILSVASKNDEDLIKDYFSKSQLIIKWEEISYPKINWNNKSENIINICESLNISPEHVLFIDDSIYELEEVKNAIPEITTFLFTKEDNENIRKLFSTSYFIKEKNTYEDSIRNESLKLNTERETLRRRINNQDAFFKDIKMTLYVKKFGDRLPEEEMRSIQQRLADLTLRTNQFNLTTFRMGSKEIAAFVADKDQHILYFSFEDRLGSYGVIAAAFIKIVNDTCIIKNIIISCRVFQRSVEYAILKCIVNFSLSHACTCIIGEYKENKKNHRFRSFYYDCGFRLTADYIFKAEISKININNKCKFIKIVSED